MAATLDGASRATLREHLSSGLKESDRLAANGEYAQANRHVNGLIAKHGAKPELLLRRGLNRLCQGGPQACVIINETAKETGLRSHEKFLNEVNNRLAADSSLPKGEAVSLVKTGDRLEFHYRMDKPLGGNAAKPEEIKEARSPIYRQDDPSLNNLDWKVPLRQSLPTVITRNQGTVVKLSSEGISRYRPGKLIVEGQEYRRLENVTTTKPRGGNRRKGSESKTNTDAEEIGDCTPEQENRGLCQPHTVYLIQPKHDQ